MHWILQNNPFGPVMGRLSYIIQLLERINKVMATQEQVDQITTDLQTAYTEIKGKISDQTDEIKVLEAAQAAGQSVDFTNLKAITKDLGDIVPDAPPVIPVDGTQTGEDTTGGSTGSDTGATGETETGSEAGSEVQ